MLDKIASWDIIDFSSSSDAEIATTLKELNIPLSVEEAKKIQFTFLDRPPTFCLLYTSPSPRDATLSRMPSSA